MAYECSPFHLPASPDWKVPLMDRDRARHAHQVPSQLAGVHTHSSWFTKPLSATGCAAPPAHASHSCCPKESQNQLSWKRPLSSSPHQLDHGTEWHIQAQRLHHLPRRSIPKSSHPLVKKFLLMSKLKHLWCILRLCPLLLSLAALEKSWLQLLSARCRKW